MKNKGYVLIEAIVVFMIIAIMVFVLLATFKKAQVEKSIDYDGGTQLVEKVPTLVDLVRETGQPALGAVEDLSERPNVGTICGNITDASEKRECQNTLRRDINIQNCIDRYSE